MSRILVVTSGLTGIFNAATKLIALLKEAGNEVTSASPRQDIDTGNLPFIHVRLDALTQMSIIKIPGDAQLRGVGGILKKNFSRSKRRKVALEQIEPKDFLPLVQSFSPDLILIDIELHEYIIQSHSTGIPVVLLNQFFSVWTSPSLPDIRSGTIVGRGKDGSKIGLRISFLKIWIDKKIQALKMSFLSGGLSRKEVLIQLARKWKFPLQYIGNNLWPGPYVYEKLPVWNMTLEALEFPHKKRENMRYIGPMVNLERKDSKAQTTNSYTLDKIFRKAEESSAKIAYCAVGTMKTKQSDFLEKLVEAMRDLPSWILILSLGQHIDEERFMDRPQNVFTFSDVPQIEALSKSDIAIVHGGIHTINECIMLKVPMLIYSGKKSDQNGNAARLIYHNVAYHGDREIDSKDDIKQKILALDQDEKIKAKMDNLYLLAKDNSDSKMVHHLVSEILKKNI